MLKTFQYWSQKHARQRSHDNYSSIPDRRQKAATEMWLLFYNVEAYSPIPAFKSYFGEYPSSLRAFSIEHSVCD